jgi:hypothetical protein
MHGLAHIFYTFRWQKPNVVEEALLGLQVGLG